MKRSSFLLYLYLYALVAIWTPLAAQTVYLRTPGTGFCQVIAASSGTPVRLTVANASLCGINADGQIILVTEMRGNTAANIHLENAADTVNLARKVAGFSGNSFNLQDLSGAPVAGNGTYLNGGRAGLATAYTLQAHPRVYLDGPAGPVTASVSSTAPGGRAHSGNVPFTALKNASASWSGGWGRDRSGNKAAALALRWLADGDGTARTKALSIVNNVTQVLGTPACDEAQRGCLAPGSSVQDYPGQFMENFSVAYSILHGQMTPAERAAFAEFVLSDLPWTNGGTGYTGDTKTKATWKIQDLTHGTVSAPTGGTVVTGTGTTFLTDVAVGDIIILPHSSETVYAYPYTVAAVDSNTSITLSSPVDGNAPVPAGSHYMVGPAWNSSLYGLQWFLKHYEYTMMCGGAVTTYPEATLVDCGANYGFQSGLYQSASDNLVLARLMGAYASGLATCGDNPLGCLLLSLSNEFYADVALPRMLTIWTGFSQSNPGYSQGRMYNIGLQIAVMTKNGVTEAPDYLAGTKLAGYGSLWGFGSVIPGPVYSFYTPNAEQGLYEAKAQLMTAPMVSLFADPAGTSAKYYKDWLTNRFPSYNETFLRDNNGEYVWWHFLYNDPAVPAVPAPTTVHFSSTDRARCVAIYGSALCPADEGKYYSTSNQNWNADRTYVAFNATSFSCLDHCSDDAGGWLLVAKNGKVLISGDSNNFMSSRAGRGYVELGGTPGNLRIAEKGPVNLYWTAGDDSYMVSNANLTSTFKAEANAVSVSRQLIHLKSGAQDYVIDHARAVTSVSTAIRGLQHFHLNQCGTPSSTSCITMNGAAATVANSQPGAKVISKALGIGGNVIIKTQGGSETDGSYPGGEGKTFRWAVCPSSNGSACTNATAAEWVVVHMPSTDSNAALPPVVQAGTGPFRIVEIQDPAFPKVAVFTAAGQTANALNFTTSHTGSAQYVVSGLEAGAYTIARNGSPAGSRVAAVGGNSISFESASGSISIDQGPPPQVLLAISAARASESAAVVQFGLRGLDFADACSLVLRLGSLSGSVLSTISSPSGPSRRTLIAGGLPSGQNIHATVTCGPDSATAQFTTGFTPPGPRFAKLIFSPPAGSPPVADLVVFYGDSPSMVNSLVASCSGGSCVALISVDAPLIYWRGVYRDLLANPVATTATHHIAPR